MQESKLKRYRFEVGNSTEGALGMVIRVWAKNQDEAIAKANEALGETEFLPIVEPGNREAGIEYANVYLAPNLTGKDLAKVDDGNDIWER